MKLRFLIISIVLSTFGLSSLAQCPDNPFVDKKAEVIVFRVVDGDTFIFMINNEEFGVRVLGIDCFETRRNERLNKQAKKAGITSDSAYILGWKAKHLADTLLNHKTVTLLRDSLNKNFDSYNRLLRNVIINGMKYDSILKARKLVI